MKKCFSLLIFSFFLLSQQAPVIYIKAGPSFSNMEWYNSISYNNIYDEGYAGVLANLGVNYMHLKFFKLSSGIGYLKAGGNGFIVVTNAQEPEKDHFEGISTRLHFLTFNTIANFKYDIKELFTPYIGLGPELYYLAGYNEKFDNMDHEYSLIGQFDGWDKLNKFIFGITGVAGIDFMLGNFVLGAEFQYSYKFNKLVDYEVETSDLQDIVFVINQISVDHSAMVFTFGYNLGKNTGNK